MAKDSRNVSSDEAARADEATSLEALIRRRARELIEAIVVEELEAALGAAESARVGTARQGYRHGTRERTSTVRVRVRGSVVSNPARIIEPPSQILEAAGC